MRSPSLSKHREVAMPLYIPASGQPLPRATVSFMATIRGDVRAWLAAMPGTGHSPRRIGSLLGHPGFLAVVVFRLAGAAHRNGLLPIARLLYILNTVLFGAELSPHAVVGPGLVILSPVGVAFGAGAQLGSRVRISQGVSIGTLGTGDPMKDGFPIVGNDCIIREGAKLLGPITIGTGTVIGPDALVVRSCLAGTYLAAAPARIQVTLGASSPEC
jgi:serine O-acetyltransferase